MAFGTATLVTTAGKTIIAARMFGATPTQLEPKYIGMGTGATGAARTAVVGDTALTTQVETRTAGTGSSSTNVHQVTGTVTASATRAVDEAGLFDASSAGNMYVSATFAVVNLASSDSIAFTWQVTFS
jgi:hypothetical protein